MSGLLQRPKTRTARLRALLSSPPLLTPGVHDGLPALLAEQAGFDAI